MIQNGEVIKYRGRAVTGDDIRSIRELIDRHPDASRNRLSILLCEAWDWRQPNGRLRDMVCRSLMLELHRSGVIKLPPARWVAKNNVIARRPPADVAVDQTAVAASLKELGPVAFRQVRRSPDERLFNGLIQRFHYLGYTRPVGEHLKFMVFAQGRPIACVAWSSAPRHLGLRDRFIGWSPEARRQNVQLLAYNTRYLIMPWVRVPHLASHLLGRMARMLPLEWERVYGHPVIYLETFVDPARYRGTCYRAANWVFLGRTKGRGHNAWTKRPQVPVKEVLGYPLSRRFREVLSCVR